MNKLASYNLYSVLINTSLPYSSLLKYSVQTQVAV